MENKTKFYEVVLNCPYNDPLGDCVINKYRQMPIIKLIEISQTINSEELDQLVALHNECLRKRKINKLAS